MRLVLLGLPPSNNNLYAVVTGRQVLSAEGRRFRAAFRAVALAARCGPPARGPFAAAITYHLRHDRDVDGSQKVILDALSRAVWHDDRQVVLLSLAKRRVPEGVLPWLSVVVRPLRAAPTHRAPSAPGDALRWGTDLLPPSTNNTYAVVGRARRLTRLGRQVHDAYAAGYRAIAADDPPTRAPLRLRIHHGFVADRRDVDGSHKLLADAANGILWDDDRQVQRLTLAKGRVADGRPRIEAAAWPWPGEAGGAA